MRGDRKTAHRLPGAIRRGTIYIDGGRDSGLAEGFQLTIKRKKPGQAEMEAVVLGKVTVVSLASMSAVCEYKGPHADVQVGDFAYLAPQDAESVRMLLTSRDAHRYAQVVSFSEGDPLDEEARRYVPKPPSAEINRLRGEFALEYMTTRDHVMPAASSSQEGFSFRADMTRLGGTYWNLTGYYRGRFTSQGSGIQGVPSIVDLVNRTYHIGLFYNNPESKWIAGVGRLYLPWAPSLDTIDGGYLARKLNPHVKAGFFAGSTPDPTAWNYDPNREIAGAFVNFDFGDFDSVKYSTTAGLAISRIHWRPDRQFVFFETSILFKRGFSLYHDLQADEFRADPLTGKPGGTGLSRSFLTLRYQPFRAVTFDVSDTYFQSLPTFDPSLIATGLLQKYLFQGLSGGIKLDLPQRISLYGSVGKNNRSGDARPSWNQMYGISMANINGTGLRVDFRYSKFDSNFGKGHYQTLVFTRELTDRLRFEAQAGLQNFHSTLTNATTALFGTFTVDWFLSRHYFLGSGITIYRGNVQEYDQTYFNFGYRF